MNLDLKSSELFTLFPVSHILESLRCQFSNLVEALKRGLMNSISKGLWSVWTVNCLPTTYTCIWNDCNSIKSQGPLFQFGNNDPLLAIELCDYVIILPACDKLTPKLCGLASPIISVSLFRLKYAIIFVDISLVFSCFKASSWRLPRWKFTSFHVDRDCYLLLYIFKIIF